MMGNITFIEAFCIIVLAIILIRPTEYREIYIRIGKLLNKLFSSELWKSVREMTRDIENLPNQIVQDAKRGEVNRIFEGLNKTQSDKIALKPRDENKDE